MTKPWQTAQWKARRKEVIKDRCEICGKGKPDGKVLVVHHPAELEQAKRVPQWRPQAEEVNKKADAFYLSLEGAQTLCKGCHWAIHQGRVRCPLCNQRWMKPQYEQCFDCLPQERKQEIQRYTRFGRCRICKVSLNFGPHSLEHYHFTCAAEQYYAQEAGEKFDQQAVNELLADQRRSLSILPGMEPTEAPETTEDTPHDREEEE